MSKGCGITLGVFLLVVSILLGGYFYKKSKTDPVVYDLTKPEILNIIKKTVATGSIKPRLEVNIKPQVSGVVEKLYVEPGLMVKKGERIAKIKLVPSQVNINSARSSVELARIRSKEAKRELERQKEVFGKKLDVEQARISYENAKVEEERQKTLYEDGIISEQSYNDYKMEKELQKTAYDNAQIYSRSNLRQFESEVDIRDQELEAAINNLALLQEGASKSSKQVSNIVVSTVDGMVLDIPVEEGSSVIERNNFNEGTTIAIVADMTSLIFEGMVDESDVGKLKEGMPLELTVGALEDQKIAATLEYISPKGVDVEGSVKFEVKAAIETNKDIFLRAGYSANADIILDRRDSVVSIKERDLIIEGDSTFVEISVGDQQFEKKQIKTGLSDGIQIEVLSGIDTTTQIKVLTSGGG